MSKFKVGDEVECVSNNQCRGITIGKKYKVVDLDRHGDPAIVNDYNETSFYLTLRFELAPQISLDEKFTPGTRIWHNSNGWGTVLEVFPKESYPVLVSYDKGGQQYCKKDGRAYSTSKLPDIFLDEVKESDWPNPPKPKPPRPSASTLVMDQEIMVQVTESDDKYTSRKFAFAQGESVFYWGNGLDSKKCSEKIIAYKATDWRLPE